jgi:hypothetical protein
MLVGALRRVHVVREAESDSGRRRFHRIEKHELLYPNVVFPLLSWKGREALRGDVYDLIAARQPERGVSARDALDLLFSTVLNWRWRGL